MKKPTKKDAAKTQGKSLVAVQMPGESPEAATARMQFRPAVNAAATANDYGIIKFSNVETDLNDLAAELQVQCDAVAKGDLGRAESMLISQAHSLEALFTYLARRAFLTFDRNFEYGEKFMRLALKAQTQGRATLETLSAVKNPPLVIAKQANVTSGPQQINNGVAREIQTEQSKLLEQTDGERLEPGAAGKASSGDLAMAAVGAVNGAQDR